MTKRGASGRKAEATGGDYETRVASGFVLVCCSEARFSRYSIFPPTSGSS